MVFTLRVTYQTLAADDQCKSTKILRHYVVLKQIHGNASVAVRDELHSSVSTRSAVASLPDRNHLVSRPLQLFLHLLERLAVHRKDVLHFVGQELTAVANVHRSF